MLTNDLIVSSLKNLNLFTFKYCNIIFSMIPGFILKIPNKFATLKILIFSKFLIHIFSAKKVFFAYFNLEFLNGTKDK